MRELSPEAEAKDMELALTREQARKLRLENDKTEFGVRANS